MRALEFPLSNNFFLCDSTHDNTSHRYKGGFVTMTLSSKVFKDISNDQNYAS